MPCWTRRETTVALDAVGIDIDRLREAAAEHGCTVRSVDGKIEIRDRRGRPAVEVTSLVKQTYAGLTVRAGMRRFGFKTKRQNVEERAGVGRVLKMRVGR